MEQAKTFEELFFQPNIGVGMTNDQLLKEVKRIHLEQCRRFVRVMVIKKIERAIERQKKTMSTRIKPEQDLIGAFLNVLEQDFKDEVKRMPIEALRSIVDLEEERLAWSLKTFTEATQISSLYKLENELQETIKAIEEKSSAAEIKEEYADCLMCLFDSAGRAGIKPQDIFDSFALKLEKNKKRVWTKNANNTYSHVKLST